MAVPSHWPWVECKRTTEDNRLPGSDHPQCSYIENIYPIIHAGHHGAVTLACNFGLRGFRYRSWLPTVWRRVFGQDTPPACELSQPRSEWVPGWTVIALHVWIDAMMAAVLYAPQWVELVLEWTGLIARETIINSESNYYSALGCKLS